MIMTKIIKKIPSYFREPLEKFIMENEIGSYEKRLAEGLVPREHYGYILLNAAKLAKKIGITKISVLEFGVAGGNGLLNLEWHSERVTKLLGVEIEVYGFDTGEGLPTPKDYRDLPYHWEKGFFKMDKDALKSRLSKAKIVFGNIESTVSHFIKDYNPAPIAAIIHDFDYYSSTISALKLFDQDENYFLPRIYCYFDDILGSELELYNDYTGQRLAISEFNDRHINKKICPAHYLLARSVMKSWYHQIYIYHDFNHSKYNQFISDRNQQLKLAA